MVTEEEAREIKQRHAPRLLQHPGVAGVGVQRDSDGSFYIAVHLSDPAPENQSNLPSELEGCPVRLIASGPFRKLTRG